MTRDVDGKGEEDGGGESGCREEKQQVDSGGDEGS